MSRRALAAALAAGAAARPAAAQGAGAAPSWSPSRPIRLLAGYPPGGGVDTTARLLSGPFAAQLGQPVVVENRPGAGGSLAGAEVARAAPDGHTLFVDASPQVVNHVLLKNLPFDYATAFTPISQVIVLPQIMIVHNGLPVRTLAEFIAYAKARPGRLSYGSSGNATASHLGTELFLRRAGLDIVHVPYRGGTPALQDLLGGNVAFVFGTVSSSLQLAREGRVRPLAVTTLQRIPPLPEVPTFAEQGFPGYELNEWNGVFAPAGLPAPIVARLHQAVLAALADPVVRQRVEALGAIPVGSDPATFARFLAEQREAMGRLAREIGLEAG
nr:tripartite tricarboxylate transporter substrate binding protein [Caldovatus aquaticus]